MTESEKSLFLPVETLEQDPKHRTCPVTTCQSAGVCVPVTVTPFAKAGRTQTICCGKPVITPNKTICAGIKNGSCTFTVTQDIRVTVPIEFGAVAATGDTYVSCLSISMDEPEHDCPHHSDDC